jgi:hypothetical protein
MPGLNTFGSLFTLLNGVKAHQFKSNSHIKSEADFDEAVRQVAKLEYVKVLQDKGDLVLNVKEITPQEEIPAVEPEVETEPEPEIEEGVDEKPKKKKVGRPKKKLY